MTEHSNENRGAIWKNEKKEKDTHPDFTGSLNVNGQEFWVSAWKRKEGAAAKAPALSFSIKPKDEQPKPAAQPSISQRAMPRGPGYPNSPRQPVIPNHYDDMNDDIPF